MQPSLAPGPSYPSLIQGIGMWSCPYAFFEHCRARVGLARRLAPEPVTA
jgi:hypothetical protein